MQQPSLAKSRFSIYFHAILSVLAGVALIACGTSVPPANAQIKVTPTAATTFWGQEPLYSYQKVQNGPYYVDDPGSNGSTFGAIRMNGTTWGSTLEPTEPKTLSDYHWDAIDNCLFQGYAISQRFLYRLLYGVKIRC